MKKIKITKEKDLPVKIEESIYCDFCGEPDKKVFTSSFDESTPQRDNNEMQVCFDCVNQLSKFTN